jgi:DNA invertase Pin-like site-specific DNA recombinase
MTSQGVVSATAVAASAVHGTGLDVRDVAVQYIRQSKGKTDKSEASPETQRDETRAKAADRGWALPFKPYEDLGRSGWNPNAERPGFDRMMRDAAAGKFSKIIIHYLTRFTRREPQEALPVVLQLWSYGITIVSVNEGEFPPNDLASLLSVIVRLEGGYRESANKSIAVHGAKKRAREAGGFVGGHPPYGFTTRKELRGKISIQVLVPIPASTVDGEMSESDVLRFAVRQIVDNMDKPIGKGNQHDASLTGICTELTERAVSTRSGMRDPSKKKRKWWDATSLKRWLQDPRIAGYDAEPIYADRDPDNPSKLGKPTGYRYNRDPETGVPLMLGFEPIVSVEDWHKVQAWLSSRDRGRAAERGESLFSGSKMLFCECGFKKVRFASEGRKSYRCPRPKGNDDGRTHDGGNTINMPALDDYVARCVYGRILAAEEDPETGDIMAEASRRFARRTENVTTAGERSSLVIERVHVRAALEEAYDREDEPEYKNPVGRRRWQERVVQYAGQLEAIETRLAALAAAETPALPLRQWLPDDPDTDPIGPGSWWHQADLDDRRDFLRLFLNRVTVHKAKHPGRPKVLDVSPRVTLTWATASEPGQEDD